MARQGITQTQVFEAADELREEGITPTVQTIRERLGSGSFSTISTHLAAWKAEAQQQALAEIPAMPQKVEAAFRQVWALSVRSAEQGLEAERQGFEAMKREMDKASSEMAVEIGRLEQALEGQVAENRQQQERLEAMQASAKAQEGQLTELRIENARLDERAKAAERQAESLQQQLQACLSAREAEGNTKSAG